ncbi:hypothetical protein [Lewinella sp. JB7]|uniref:hypothetical protein n=1 Tax=Lewinella sp. JB7 TaxID=2962887 RepID=UPI0020CA264F|nr:hypothetical protein [Lewinella sp. JB7]MCP9234649.1 hypothetical protein [Lewinella sp. JB7]
MDKIRQAVAHFFDLESQLKVTYTAPSPEAYNATLQSLKSYHRHPGLRAVYASRTGPWPAEQAARYAALATAPMRRRCCKISRYRTADFGELYAVYASSPWLESSERVDYQKCFWWTGGDGSEPGILADYTWPWGEEPVKEWFFHSGDARITFAAVGSPEEIVRLLPPTSDPAAVRDYLADK